MKKAIKSKKFVVYIYQGNQGGACIHRTNAKGLMTKKSLPFKTKEQGLRQFGKLLDKYLK